MAVKPLRGWSLGAGLAHTTWQAVVTWLSASNALAWSLQDAPIWPITKVTRCARPRTGCARRRLGVPLPSGSPTSG